VPGRRFSGTGAGGLDPDDLAKLDDLLNAVEAGVAR
jgi:hypothetical protein